MSKKKKVLIIVLISVISLILAVGTFTGTTYALYEKENKAIIILPGLFASALYDTQSGEGVWDPFEELDLQFSDFMDESGALLLENIVPLLLEEVVVDELANVFAEQYQGNDDSFIKKIAMEVDGTPSNENVKPVPWESSGRLKFGPINAQKLMYDALHERYSDYYDVQIFNYDFRLDNRVHAQLLEKYINDKGYTDVILVSHSNGGQVAGIYLARSEENRKKVSKYISYNSPYYGSFSAISILENIDGMISGLTETLNSNGLSFLSEKIEGVFNLQFKKLLNMWTVYQLLPSYELLTQEYNGEEAGIFIDNQKMDFEDNAELLEFYCSRPWAKNSEGDIHVALEQWLDYKDSLMVEMADGKKVMSTTLVDTTYFSGMNVNGTNKIYYTTNDDDSISHTSSGYCEHGDGTVTLLSAVAAETDMDRIRYFDGYNHYGVNTAFNKFAKQPTYDAIDKKMDENLSFSYKLWSDMLKKD